MTMSGKANRNAPQVDNRCLVFIIYATLSSINTRPEIAGSVFTVLEHFGAYAVLGFLFHLAYRRHLTFVCIMVFGVCGRTGVAAKLGTRS